jgi:hypothetical protein
MDISVIKTSYWGAPGALDQPKRRKRPDLQRNVRLRVLAAHPIRERRQPALIARACSGRRGRNESQCGDRVDRRRVTGSARLFADLLSMRWAAPEARRAPRCFRRPDRQRPRAGSPMRIERSGGARGY